MKQEAAIQDIEEELDVTTPGEIRGHVQEDGCSELVDQVSRRW